MPKPTADLQAHAESVITTTTRAWNVSRESPRALARRAPRGYVPVRVLRRLRSSLPAASRLSAGDCLRFALNG